MRVGGGSNCHEFGDKHIFYVLYVIPISVFDAGGSNFSDAGMGLVPIMFPGSTTLHALDPYYWTPTDLTNTLSISALKLYSSFCGSSN